MTRETRDAEDALLVAEMEALLVGGGYIELRYDGNVTVGICVERLLRDGPLTYVAIETRREPAKYETTPLSRRDVLLVLGQAS